jgi:hypothetical protein
MFYKCFFSTKLVQNKNMFHSEMGNTALCAHFEVFLSLRHPPKWSPHHSLGIVFEFPKEFSNAEFLSVSFGALPCGPQT